LVDFLRLWYHAPAKIWQPWRQAVICFRQSSKANLCDGFATGFSDILKHGDCPDQTLAKKKMGPRFFCPSPICRMKKRRKWRKTAKTIAKKCQKWQKTAKKTGTRFLSKPNLSNDKTSKMAKNGENS
jgi:hypothetical protein